MAKTIKVIGSTQKPIKVIGPTQEPVNPDLVAKALGAEKVGIQVDTSQGPISLFSLRQILVKLLHSTGGRPKLKGTRSERTKISLFKGDKEKLKKIAKYVKDKEGQSVSSSQIASYLIHQEIKKFEALLTKNLVKTMGK